MVLVAKLTAIQSPLNFFLNQVLICYSHFQICELCHISKTSVICLYVIILPCIPVTREQHIRTYEQFSLCYYRQFLCFSLWYIEYIITQ
jgi:hypothetical protein